MIKMENDYPGSGMSFEKMLKIFMSLGRILEMIKLEVICKDLIKRGLMTQDEYNDLGQDLLEQSIKIHKCEMEKEDVQT